MINFDSRLSLVVLSIFLLLQLVFLSPGVSADSLGSQAESMTAKQAVRDSQQARDKMTNNFDEMSKYMREGQVDKVVDMETECAKEMVGQECIKETDNQNK